MSDQDQKRGAQAPSAPEQAADRQTIARRKLLKMAYAAPVIVGTLLLSEDAAAQAVSCGPLTNPCNPPPPCKPRPTPTVRTR